jgi:hypothetical protein
MELVRIFEVQKNKLYAIKFNKKDTDEFRKAFKQWNDVEYLESFFEKNISDLNREFWNYIDVESAVLRTIEESAEFEKYILIAIKEGGENNECNLNNLVFKPLNEYETQIEYQKSKAYGTENKSWLRIYAIRVCANVFVVTGSAIKLTATMNEREHTLNELNKIEKVILYLKQNYIIDEDDFGYLEIEF